ncbi:hypothetical protein Sste5346_009145 [Sporothrix stenoceras]|uniref:Uncharacterized protein n=1 Tax=Sporothrix stenoceras TaxID=5173 RepID=A0ABR3YML3_9PEZI
MQDAIRTQFNITPDSVMEAMSMLSMAPEGFTAAVQAADIVYKAGTKVEDARANLIKKSFVVLQIGTCEGSLSSLAATSWDFTERVPEIAGEVKKRLAAFLAVVTKRNGDVLHYNGLIETLHKLEAVHRHYVSEAQRLGEHVLGLTPSLPAVYFWLKRLKREYLLQIMQEINNQARALSFWGPMPVKSVTFAPPGPMDGSLQLRLHQETLLGLFEKSYEGFQSGGWHSWPEDKSFLGEGICVSLKASAIESLQETNEALLTITPQAHTDFLDMANVRVTQVRVWLLNATVSAHDPDAPHPRYPLRVKITQCGDDTIWTPDGKPCVFRHTPVTMHFSYETIKFNETKGIFSGAPDPVYGRQDIEHDYAGGPSVPGAADKPPIGPFGVWKIVVRKDVNPGLNLTGVTAGWIEFCGRNKAATSPLQGIE